MRRSRERLWMVNMSSIFATDCTHTYEDEDFLSHTTCTLLSRRNHFSFLKHLVQGFGREADRVHLHRDYER